MNYTDFVRTMQVEVKEQMNPDVMVELHTAVKNNGMSRIGLVLMQKGVNISPTIYLEEFYSQYREGTRIKELAQIIHDFYKQVKVNTSYPYENILSYKKIRHKIVFKLINKEANQELLAHIPYEEYLDLAVVYYAVLEHTEFGTATLLICNSHLRCWKVTKADVKADAMKNAPTLMPAILERLTDYMYVATNCIKNLGAAVMLYPGMWKTACERIGESFYILPSSIHELILIPVSYGVGQMQLEIVVEEMNHKEVDAEEVLSNSVYYYDAEKGEVLM